MALLGVAGDSCGMTTRLRYSSCWAETVTLPTQGTGEPGRPRQISLQPVGTTHAFLPGRATALCGSARAYDNGSPWPLGSEICEMCDTLAQLVAAAV